MGGCVGGCVGVGVWGGGWVGGCAHMARNEYIYMTGLHLRWMSLTSSYVLCNLHVNATLVGEC